MLIDRGLILGCIHLAFLKGLYGAKLTGESLEQSFSYMQGLKHPLVHGTELSVNFNLQINKQNNYNKRNTHRHNHNNLVAQVIQKEKITDFTTMSWFCQSPVRQI